MSKSHKYGIINIIKKYLHIGNIIKTGGQDMKRGYVVAMVNIDGKKYNFINGKKSKSKLERKNLVPSDVIKDAIQIGRGGYVKFTSYDKVVFKLVKSKNKSYVEVHSGKNNIYVYSDKLKIKHIQEEKEFVL